MFDAQRDDLDPSNGYEAVAAEFIKRRRRSDIGVSTVCSWAKSLPPGASILDLGCGDGVPISRGLIEAGSDLYGVDASLRMVQAFRQHFPQTPVVHEPVEDSAFFNRKFDGCIAWGLMFLLSPEVQVRLIQRVSQTLLSGGRFLFTSPEQTCSWIDVLTGRESVFLGVNKYRKVAEEAGFKLVERYWDEGDNHYYAFEKP